jgi:hypothetical protein
MVSNVLDVFPIFQLVNLQYAGPLIPGWVVLFVFVQCVSIDKLFIFSLLRLDGRAVSKSNCLV